MPSLSGPQGLRSIHRNFSADGCTTSGFFSGVKTSKSSFSIPAYIEALQNNLI